MSNFNEHILFEQMLTSELTIGFEFECFYPKSSKKLIKEIVKKYNIDQVDEDITVPDEEMFDKAEFRTVPVHLNNDGIITTYKLFKEFYEAGCRTNQSCGLHTHFAISKELTKNYVDNFWFIFNFFGGGIYNKFKNFDGHLMFNEGEIINKSIGSKGPPFASIEKQNNYINNIKKLLNNTINKEEKLRIINNTIKELKTISNKNFLIRLHEQGTIEWRGPRHLFDYYDDLPKEQNLTTLKKYLLFAVEFGKEIIKLIHNPFPISDISKKEYEYYLYTQRSKSYLSDEGKSQLYKTITKYIKNPNILNIILNAIVDNESLDALNKLLQEPITLHLFPYMKKVGIGNTEIEILRGKTIFFKNWYIHDTMLDFRNLNINNVYFKECVFDKCEIIPSLLSFNIQYCDFSNCKIKIPSKDVSKIMDKINADGKIHTNTSITIL